MGRTSVAAVSAIVALLWLAPLRASAPAPAREIWFSPDPGTIDYMPLFEHPEQWPHARDRISVFKFYQQHTLNPPASIVGPNSYDALARAGAFRMLTAWNKKIAVEVGSVKDFYCTPDSTGMNAAIGNTLDSVRAVQAAGGSVAYLAMDEPFVSGRLRVCGGPALEPTADRVATYVAGVAAAFPNVRIGLIEAYPFSSETAIESILQLLASRKVVPAFLHMDVDWHLAGSTAFRRDMPLLQAACAAAKIPFGIILTGYNGEADALYSIDVYGLANLVADTFGTWDRMPDQIVFQSWAQSATGLLITPENLPEDRLYTHTRMILDVLRRLEGATGPATGTAVPR